MILVVEYHPDTREALLRMLKLKRYDAVAVSEAGQALLFLRTHPLPALTILDVSMPHLDGMAVLRALRADERLAALAVLVFSSDDRPRDEAMRLGAAGYVVKGSLAWEHLAEQIDRLAAGGYASVAGAGESAGEFFGTVPLRTDGQH